VRLAWCTPFSRHSAIGAVSRVVAEQLARTCDVEVFYPATSDPLSTALTTHPMFVGENATSVLADFDLVVYCMGNHLWNHKSIADAQQRVPGIVILHDLVLHHFFVDHCFHSEGGKQRYLREIGRLYGAEERERARVGLESAPADRWQPVHPELTPMFELFIAGATGVVTHSEYARDRVREKFLGPVAAIPLPVVPRAHRLQSAELQDDGKVVVSTIGQINPNKQIADVIEALGRDPSLAARVRYLVVGPCPDAHRRELEALVVEHGLEDVVELRGRVDEEELDAVLAASDVCVNLRRPCIEAASASLGEEMWYGKPTIVADAGCYSELPDDAVVKIDPDDPVGATGLALRMLVDDVSRRRAVGERAAAYARAHLRADLYAAKLVAFVDEVLASRPFLAVADALGHHLGRLGVSAGMPVVDESARVAHELFADAAPGGAVNVHVTQAPGV
jgi:glycosyltransferase involved in cell wall biosynthesis